MNKIIRKVLDMLFSFLTGYAAIGYLLARAASKAPQELEPMAMVVQSLMGILFMFVYMMRPRLETIESEVELEVEA